MNNYTLIILTFVFTLLAMISNEFMPELAGAFIAAILFLLMHSISELRTE
ncbi:hypothetical protein [Methanosarcina sp. KYL-1]|nr:hypothetical protein [Methanosarcina sp. KYL-1]